MELTIGETNDGYLSIKAYRTRDTKYTTVYVNSVDDLVAFIDMVKDYEPISLRFERMATGRREHIISEIRNNITM